MTQDSAAGTPTPVPSLIGGPLHWLGARLGLVNVQTGNSIALGLAIAAGLWLVLLVLALVGGSMDRVFALDVIGAHARILLAIPLMFVCEKSVNPHLARLSNSLIASGVVREHARGEYLRLVTRFNRDISSPIVEAVLVLIAFAVLWAPSEMHLPGATGAVLERAEHGKVAPAGLWYGLICLPLFQFLVFRWAWRLAMWWLFVWRVSRLDLHLVPTHPDRAAGLGYLSSVQGAFVSLTAAISVTIAGSIAEDIALTGTRLNDLYPLLAVVLLIDAVLFLAPLYFFVSALRGARSRGLVEYMDLAAGYVSSFEKKWLRGGAKDESLLGSADVQSLADLDSAVSIVVDTRIAPVSHALLSRFALWAIVPFAPLLLFEFPLQELVTDALKMIIGR